MQDPRKARAAAPNGLGQVPPYCMDNTHGCVDPLLGRRSLKTGLSQIVLRTYAVEKISWSRIYLRNAVLN